MTTTVYVLNYAADYEGEETLGVFWSAEAALAEARTHRTLSEDRPMPEPKTLRNSEGHPVAIELRRTGDMSGLVVRPFEVKGD